MIRRLTSRIRLVARKWREIKKEFHLVSIFFFWFFCSEKIGKISEKPGKPLKETENAADYN